MADQYVKGLRELNDALNALPQNIAKNILRGAVNAGAAVIRKEAALRAPVYEPGKYGVPDMRVEPGRLKRAIYQAHAPELSSAIVQTVLIGVRQGKSQRQKQRGKQTFNLDAYYAKWVEFGHWYVPRRGEGITRKAHRAKHKSDMGRFIPARPFMRPAFEAKKDDAIKAIEQYLRERIPREASKLGITYAVDSGTANHAA
uniref:HK97-gp10 family putative phage morphogenesis protein n=1 Tax=Cupriavidus taiwanensis TaxID=164546 RepID=UPI0018DD7585|nr:HK97-gp10 family putative phage morphogenesis protein [Cupriavidus taiwanensis]